MRAGPLLLLAAACGGAGASEATLAIQVHRASTFAAPVDGLLVRVEAAGATYEHRAEPTPAFDAGGDVLWFLAGDLRGGCVVEVLALEGTEPIGSGVGTALLGTDEDVVVEVSAAKEGLCLSCADAEPPATLRGFWRFEESSGDALDESADAHHASVLGAPLRGEPGLIGQGIELFGAEALLVPDAASLDLVGDLTIEAWIRPESFGGNCGTSGNAIVSKWRSSLQGQFLLATCSSARLRFVLSTGSSGILLSSNASLEPGAPVHVAARVAAGVASLLINGVLDAELSLPAAAPAASEFPGDDLTLGGGSQPGWGFDGLLDEIRLWSEARGASDICRDAGGLPAGESCDLSGVLP